MVIDVGEKTTVLNAFRGRFLFLLVSILLYFVLKPFLEGTIGIGILLDIFFSLILFSGIYAASEKRYLFVVGLIIALPALVALWVTEFMESPSLRLVGHTLMIPFFGYTTIIILSYLFRQDEVTSDVIMGAVCVYFFIGLMWSSGYNVLESLQPGSFHFGSGQTADISNITYDSFVTQTTLSVDDTAKIIDALRAKFPAILGPRREDICYATTNRQDAVRQLALETDLVLVVGSPNSSNSNRLRELAERCGATSYLIDGPEEIDPAWLEGVNRVGVTAGASAPETLVRQVVERLRECGGEAPHEREGREENIRFSMPKGLR